MLIASPLSGSIFLIRVFVGLYTILPLPVVSGIYCNNGGSGGNILLRDIVGDNGVVWGV